MRRFVPILAAALALGAATPALADNGLPTIASFMAGPIHINVDSDSPTPHTGLNTFTVEIPGLEHGSRVQMHLVGPTGQRLDVPLQDLLVLSDPMEGMDMSASAQAEAGAGGHSMPGMNMSGHDMDGGHGAAGHDATGHDAATHGGSGSASSFRGSVALGVTGQWSMVLDVKDDKGTVYTAAAPIDVEQGGPGRPYLGFTGLLIGGSVSYGIVKKNRRG